MTFKDLQKANENLKKTLITRTDKKTGETISNEYVPVNERIKAFRMLYPNGIIDNEIVSLGDGIVVMKCTVKDDLGSVLGIGHAYEKEDANYINKTSYIENCETSAVGRALGMVGIGIDTSVASAEEMENAIHQQSQNEPITPAQIRTLEACIPEHGQTVEKTCEVYKVKSLSELTVPQFKHLMDRMGEK